MSLKDLFNNLDSTIVSSGSLDRIANETESVEYLDAYLEQQNKFRAHIDFSQPTNFIKFGSAEKYYTDAISRIHNTYPYDGSRFEKIQYELSSSDLDKYIFEKEYPRTNGHVIFSGDGWSTQTSTTNGYGNPSTNQYIFIKSGPNTSNRFIGKDIQDTSGDYKSGFANFYDLTKNRESNLKIGGIDGNTVEFFLKKSEFVTSLTEKEVVLDVYTTLFAPGESDYGRLRVTLTGSNGVPFLVTYQSGTSGFQDELLGQNITTSSIADGNWHHYAISFKNSDSQVEAKLYVDGKCNHTITTGSSINYVSGNINATLGALGTKPDSSSTAALGDGKLSGSIDEFRFWKTQRNSQQVNRHMREQIGGGTNTDDANTTLGVYYKFNEGITQTASVDQTILDYSGRISNGTFVGYDATVRNVNSAFVDSGLVASEFKDPILYDFHPSVVSYKNDKVLIGREYDYTNPNSIYNSIPSWITETDNTKDEPPLENLTQIISSYFDTLHGQIENISKLKHTDYVSGSDKPFFFNDRILQGVGFPYIPDLFSNATFFEYFRNRNDERLFEEKLYDIKNIIYRNIYNNLAYINKTKGTEKSFRNMLRCFGMDEEIYKIRYYATDAVHEFRDNYKSIVESKNYVNFALTGTSEATVYQYKTDSNTTSFISGSGEPNSGLESTGFGFTVEAQAIFPIVTTAAEYNTILRSKSGAVVTLINDFVIDKETSVYGMRTADSDLGENILTIPNRDRAGFVVKAVRDDEFTKRAYFKLTPTDATSYFPTITSSYFEDVFDNTKWNFAVSVKPTKYGQFDLVSGSTDNATYDVTFQGINTVLDEVRDSFQLSSSISKANGQDILTKPKRVFAGALRENLSGSLVTRANSFVTDCRFWLAPLSFVDITKHNIDFENSGIEHPYRNAYLFQSDGRHIRVPNAETLALNWNFLNLSSSNGSGQFEVTDYSSGSNSDARFGDLSGILSRQHSGRGDHFLVSSNDTFEKKNVYNAKLQLPEYINSYDMIRIANQDDVTFTRDTRPTNYLIAIEKSMYQSISEEMIKVFSTIADFGSLVGYPANKFRVDNKQLIKLRQMFFENVSNTPKLEKYIDYYKWFDSGLNTLLNNLMPATAVTFDENNIIRPIIEEYIFNREKYLFKFPTLELKQSDPEGNILGIGENLYNWKFGHSPLNQSQLNNCIWWEERAKRDNASLTSGNPDVDLNRNTILTVLNNQNNASAPNLSGSGGAYQGSTYAIKRFARPYKIKVTEARGYGGGTNFSKVKNLDYIDPIIKIFDTHTAATKTNELRFNKSDFFSSSCEDDKVLNDKPKVDFWVRDSGDNANPIGTGEKLAPFNVVSSSEEQTSFTTVNVVNLHNDTYGSNKEVPMQGPFTEKLVGGKQYRHVWTNINVSDTIETRPEGWRYQDGAATSYIIPAAQDALQSFNANLPRAVYYRDEIAKRPINIKNHLQTTGSLKEGFYTVLGNYSNGYEIVMTNGRSINNRYLAESDGDLSTTTIGSYYVSGALEFSLPRRDLTGSNSFVIVNRFSAPGDFSTMNEGMLDVEAAEYSVYNALPWRNLSVRVPLNKIYSDHTKQFGYFSDAFDSASYALAGLVYPGSSGSVNSSSYYATNTYLDATASFHKINRNARKQIKYSNKYFGNLGTVKTASVYDNWFVQHQIPQTDIQYAWISASIVENYTGSALYWFEQPDFSNASFASTDITFMSASDSGGGRVRIGPTAFKVDFAGLSVLVLDNVLSASNLLSSSDYLNTKFATLHRWQETNALILHRNGPYGAANWKLYKKDNHPIVRAHRSENRLSFITKEVVQDSKTGFQIFSYDIGSVIEPPINSKHFPVEYDLIVKNSMQVLAESEDQVGTSNIRLKQSYLNNFVKFSDKVENSFDLNNGGYYEIVEGYQKKKLAYSTLTDLISKDSISLQTNPIKNVNLISTSEIIFPREKYTYLSTHRQRENYVNNYWRDDRQVRATKGAENLLPFLDYSGLENPEELSDYGLYNTASIWSLDSRLNFSNGSCGRIASGALDGRVGGIIGAVSSSTDQAGILQNSAYPYSIYVKAKDRPYTDSRSGLYAILLPQYNRRIAGVIADDLIHEYKFGDTKWEAADQASINPFYDTYPDYVDDIKRNGKDCSIIPEFRISEHMDYYLNSKGGDFLADNTASLSLTGATIPDQSEKSFMVTYSHTDFLKAFNVVGQEYKEKFSADTIELECDGLIKFLPYNGFYPAERTVELTKLFWESYNTSFNVTGNIFQPGGEAQGIGDNITTLQAGFISPIWKPLFAPGILYNSVKSGIAVDYPVHTVNAGPIEFSGSPKQRNHLGYLEDIPRITTDFDYRVPFEALVDPEAFISAKIIDNEPHPSASMPLTASLASGKENYKLAMHNFLASTVDFFKEGGELTSLASLPDNNPNFGLFDIAKEYRMRIVCSNAKIKNYSDIKQYFSASAGTMEEQRDHLTPSYEWNPQTLVMYARTGSDPKQRSDYYGSSFGPPCDNESLLKYDTATYPLYGSASYEPFTPPYYDGYSHIELTYKPEFSDSSLAQIVAELSQSFVRQTTGIFVSNEIGPAIRNRMQLSSSFNYLQLEEVKSVVLDALGNTVQVGGDSMGAGNRLVIQPKWETPILNFKDVSVASPLIGSGSVARGMWHQYGSIPKASEGIFLQIQDLDASEMDDSNATASLADALGFSKQSVKLGGIAKQKEIFEAVVAIPFIATNPESEEGNYTRFNISKEVVGIANDVVVNGGISETIKKIQSDTPQLYPSQEIIDMVQKMKKYVIPPQFDFITNTTIEPFAMFIFEFSTILSQQDLANVWQNLSPNIGTTMQKSRASLPIDLFQTGEIPEQGTSVISSIPSNIQWKVFKVKQKSAWNYFEKTAEAEDKKGGTSGRTSGGGGRTSGGGGRGKSVKKTSTLNYNYNWPYDFFSLVELGKINFKADFAPKYKKVITVVKPEPYTPSSAQGGLTGGLTVGAGQIGEDVEAPPKTLEEAMDDLLDAIKEGGLSGETGPSTPPGSQGEDDLEGSATTAEDNAAAAAAAAGQAQAALDAKTLEEKLAAAAALAKMLAEKAAAEKALKEAEAKQGGPKSALGAAITAPPKFTNKGGKGVKHKCYGPHGAVVDCKVAIKKGITVYNKQGKKINPKTGKPSH